MKKTIAALVLSLSSFCFSSEIKTTLAVSTIEITGNLFNRLFQFGPAQLTTFNGSIVVGTIKNALFSGNSFFVSERNDNLSFIVEFPRNIFNTIVRFPDTFIGNHPYASFALSATIGSIFAYRYYNAQQTIKTLNKYRAHNSARLDHVENNVVGSIQNLADTHRQDMHEIGYAVSDAATSVKENLKYCSTKFEQTTEQHKIDMQDTSNSMITLSKQETESQMTSNHSIKQVVTQMHDDLAAEVTECGKNTDVLGNSIEEFKSQCQQTDNLLNDSTNTQKDVQNSIAHLEANVETMNKTVENLGETAHRSNQEADKTGEVINRINNKMSDLDATTRETSDTLKNNTSMLEKLLARR